MGTGSIPQNVFRLTKDDEESTSKLRLMLSHLISKKSAGLTYNNLKTSQEKSSLSPNDQTPPTKIEIRLTKSRITNSSHISVRNSKEETKSTLEGGRNNTNGHTAT